jgi:hypothetical protein
MLQGTRAGAGGQEQEGRANGGGGGVTIQGCGLVEGAQHKPGRDLGVRKQCLVKKVASGKLIRAARVRLTALHKPSGGPARNCPVWYTLHAMVGNVWGVTLVPRKHALLPYAAAAASGLHGIK